MTSPARAPSAPARTRTLERFASDAEVLELVARHALGVKLTDRLDRRHLRRLNSARNRYALARAAAAATNRRERRTTRMAIATSLYGPDVELDNVLRQMRRVEADLAAAGLLEVEVLTTAGGRPRGIVERLLDPPALSKRERARTRHVARRPETRRQAIARRHTPHRRQQSDRLPRGGVPGLYVRSRDVSELELELPPRARAARRRGAHREIARVGPASPLGGTGGRTSERDARGACAPAPAPRPRSETLERDDVGRDRSGSKAPRSRWAALSRLRTAGTETAGPERLRRAAVDGAPVCSVAAAAFEGRFVVDGPWSYRMLGEHPLEHELGVAEARREGTLHSNRPVYRPIGDRWAARLEAYCRIYDRAAGEQGAGILWLLEDLLAWRPADGAPAGHRYDGVDPGWPASLAYFIARLGREAKRRRRDRDPRRRQRALWHWEDGEPERRARKFRRG
jgi:hypothetical protein